MRLTGYKDGFFPPWLHPDPRGEPILKIGTQKLKCRKRAFEPQFSFYGLALQRHLEGFPFFEFPHGPFTMRFVGLVVASFMIVHQQQAVGALAFRLRKTSLQ